MHYIKYILILFVSIFIFDISIKAYTAYSVGQEIEYNDIKFYVIKNSSSDEDSVTMLKAEPLTYQEISDYAPKEAQTSNNSMQYHASSSAYDGSYIKTTVDAWKNANASDATEARLITIDEVTSLGYELKQTCDTCGLDWVKTDNVPNWLYNSNYDYWTMSAYHDYSSSVWFVKRDGTLSNSGLSNFYGGARGVVRPVIVLPITGLKGADESIIDDDTDKGNDKLSKVDSNDTKGLNTADNETSEIKSTVKVDNTYMRNSIITIIIGFIIASASIFILYKLRNKVK